MFAETDDLSYEDLVKLRVVSDGHVTSVFKTSHTSGLAGAAVSVTTG